MSYSGIICIDKPEGFTSFDVIAKLRGMLRTKKLGHSGTLDPMATGVLPVFAGNATRAVDMLSDHDKTYIAGFRLGMTSDTQDITGKLVNTGAVLPSYDNVKETVSLFTGDLMQIPPMYSAVSVNGKRLYELARQGKEIERAARPVTVYSSELLGYDENTGEGTVSFSCSKGTYVRTLINDIGDKLGCGAVMTSLRRTRACGFDISECITLDSLQTMIDEGKDIEALFRSVDKVFEELPELRLDAKKTVMYKNGVKLYDTILNADNSELYRVYGNDGEFIGIAVHDMDNGVVKVRKNFF